MLEYFTYKKYKKHRDEKTVEKGKGKEKQDAKDEPAVADQGFTPETQVSAEEPVLSDDDERFFQRITSPEEFADEDGRRPPLPPRVKTPEISWESDNESSRAIEMLGAAGKEEGKEISKVEAKDAGKSEAKKANRFSFFNRKSKKPTSDGVEPERLAVPDAEADKEKKDITDVLDDLNLAAKDNKTFSLSKESNELVRQFTVVLKDLVNGVPTAAKDLQNLLQDRDGVISKNFEKLPKSLKKLVEQLPNKLTGSLAPELLAVAAESQGLAGDTKSKSGFATTAKKLFMPKNIQDLVTKPGAIVGMLKAIVNALKVRWPAFMGTNVIWSIALFLLLFVLWYCHKRGREVRLEQENTVEGGDRVEELPDDPTLPGPSSAATPSIQIDLRTEESTAAPSLPPPPIGEHAPGATTSVPELLKK